ncbi:MAG: adenylate/guanylate cyclase domain-containing protein [Solirubrobacterales bacterium]|nr:adenylate/guanylate cyclase domain-containing protein [Solirubrobacterales bacterium]
MARRASGLEVVDSVRRSLTLTLLVSNGVGAAIVFIFTTLVLKVAHAPPVGKVLLVNAPVFVVYMLVTSFLIPRKGNRVALPRLQWLIEERPPTTQEQRLVLRNPLLQAKLVAVAWGSAALLFGVINLYFSVQIATNAVTGIVMGGLVTTAVCYLLGERAVRPVTARALEHGVPLQPVAPGVIARTLLAWGTATAIPVIAIAEIAWGMINGDTPRTVGTAWSLIFLAVLGLCVGALAILIAAKSIAEPVRSVRTALAAVEEGRTDVEVEVNDASEVGLLQAGFNQMAAGLREREQLKDLFGRHVGEDVARRAMAAGVELGGEVREAAVLFVDVVGSTALAENAAPHDVVERLNVFFGIVLEVVSSHGGWVNKFEGDATLCVFGVPSPLEDPAGCALAAARELCSRLEAESPLEAGIGVSAGEVVAGNVGAAERFEYTVIGDPVNEAARLTDAAKQYRPRLLASGRALGRAASDEGAHWQLDGELTLTGRSQPTVLARPAEVAEPDAVRIGKTTEGT